MADRVRLALVLDPLSEREYVATAHAPLPSVPTAEVAMKEAVISLVTNYSDTGYEWFRRADALAAKRCRRAVNLWAPALGLALVASGAIDAMVCHGGLSAGRLRRTLPGAVGWWLRAGSGWISVHRAALHARQTPVVRRGAQQRTGPPVAEVGFLSD
jgi:hypothetical protein